MTNDGSLSRLFFDISISTIKIKKNNENVKNMIYAGKNSCESYIDVKVVVHGNKVSKTEKSFCAVSCDVSGSIFWMLKLLKTTAIKTF